MGDLMLDVDQAGELKAAFRRGGWTNAEIKWLCEGDRLAQFRRVKLGEAGIIVLALLMPIGEPITVSCPVHDPRTGFWETGPDLWVDSDLARHILPAARALPAHKALVDRFDFRRDAYDRDIRKDGSGIPTQHLWTASKFLSTAATMIGRQPKGCAGDLLNSGRANIFYVEGMKGVVFAVSVRWYSDNGQWGVRVWRLDGSSWNAGHRVLSPATVPATL